MSPIDQQIAAVTAMLQARGANIHIDPNAPDAVKLAWLKIIMECPDCWGENRS